MKKLLLLLPLFFIFLTPPSAFASPQRAATPSTYTGCQSGGGCTSYMYWNGDQNGMELDTTLSNPGLVNSVAAWERDFRVHDYIQGLAAIHVGFVKSNGMGLECAVGGPYFYTYAITTTGQTVGNLCALTNSSDWNKPVHLQINLDSRTGVMTSSVTGAFTSLHQIFSYANVETTYNRINY